MILKIIGCMKVLIQYFIVWSDYKFFTDSCELVFYFCYIFTMWCNTFHIVKQKKSHVMRDAYIHIGISHWISRSWRGVIDTKLTDKVCQWLAAAPVSFTDITEILLKVALSTIPITTHWIWLPYMYNHVVCIEYASPHTVIRLKTHISKCKSNYHLITITSVPSMIW